MTHSPIRRRGRPLPALALLVLLPSGWLADGPARAADLHKAVPSLGWVPEDAAFYSAMLRNREQIEAVLKSRAWARLTQLPLVQVIWAQAKNQLEQPDSSVAEVRRFFDQPENRKLLELFGDMMAEEVFCFGGPSAVNFLSLLGEVNGSAQWQRFSNVFQGKRPNDPLTLARGVLDSLAENPDVIEVPDLVIGFRIKDAKRAQAQIRRLEQLAQQALPPFLQGRLNRTPVGNADFLTLTLDGKLIPWDQVPLKDLEEKPGQYKELVKKLTDLKVTVSLGVKDQYLLLGVGASTEHLARLGKAGKGLTARPEFKPLTRFADRRLTSINYVSKATATKLGTSKDDLNGLAELANQYLPMLELTDEQQARVRKDLNELARDLKKFIPEPGAGLSFAFLTERGQESYAHDWAETIGLDSSKPLTILNHAGGSPILVTAGRSKYSPEDYRLLVKWVKVLYRYAEEFGVPQLEDAQKAQFEKLSKALIPLAEHLDDVTDKMLLPALADGQTALVLDAKLKSNQWVILLPAAQKPLPMLEPAIVAGVSDAKLLRKAFTEYGSIANEALAKLHELLGDDFPEFQIPPPETKKGKAGELFFYPLPAAVPLSTRLAPTAGLSDRVAVLALAPETADRLMAGTPLKVDSLPLADTKRPLAQATYFSWAALVEAVAPWVESGLGMAAPFIEMQFKKLTDDVGPKMNMSLLDQVRALVEVMKVWRGYSSATYFEDGALVTHGETLIRDLAK